MHISLKDVIQSQNILKTTKFLNISKMDNMTLQILSIHFSTAMISLVHLDKSQIMPLYPSFYRTSCFIHASSSSPHTYVIIFNNPKTFCDHAIFTILLFKWKSSILNHIVNLFLEPLTIINEMTHNSCMISKFSIFICTI